MSDTKSLESLLSSHHTEDKFLYFSPGLGDSIQCIPSLSLFSLMGLLCSLDGAGQGEASEA